MAEGDNITELGLSTEQAVRDVLRLAGVLDEYANKLDQVRGVTRTFSQEGELAAAVVKEFNSALNRTVTSTFTQTEDGFERISQKVTQTTQAVKGFSDAMLAIQTGALANRQQAGRDAEADAAARALRDATIGGNASGASAAEMKRYEAAVRGVVSEISKGNMTLGEMNALWAKVASGAADFTIREQEVVAKFQAVQTAANEFGTTAVNAQNRAARAAQVHLQEQQKILDALHMQAAANRLDAERAAAVRGAQAGLTGAFGTKLGNATPQQILAYNAAITQAINLVQRGRVSADQFAESLDRVARGKPAAGLTGDMAKLEGYLMRARNAFENLGKTGEGAGQRFLMSWQNVIKMFEGQVLFHLFSKMQQGFQEGIATAGEFSKKIALIQTISQDSGVGYGQWAKGIREVSDAMGTPLVETAAAGYDLLSNQVTRGAETMSVLRQAMEFGRTTNASTEDSVNLLSSAINAFQMGTGGAERAARVFFTTIDLGRVTATDMANSFGRSGVLAETLGVRFEELNAAISSMTRQGIRSHEAYTLINNVFMKLIKPTEEMQKWLKKMGYETGQDAVQALGFAGVLKLLDQEFQGNTAKVAKFFDELRGARGAINLTGQGLKEFLADLEQMDKSAGNYDLAKKLVADSPGMKMQVELNKVKNYFINDFGMSVVRTITDIADKWGGFANVVVKSTEVVKHLIVIVGGLYGAFKIAQIVNGFIGLIQKLWAAESAYKALEVAARSFNLAAMGPVGIAVGVGVAVGSLVAYVQYLNRAEERTAEYYRTLVAQAKQADQELLNVERGAQDARNSELTKGLETAKQAFMSYFATVRAEYNKAAEAIKETQADIVESMKSTFDALKGILSNGVSELERQAQKAKTDVEKAQAAKVDMKEGAEKGLFERKMKDAQQAHDAAAEIDLVNKRLEQLQKESEEAWGRDDIDGAIKKLKEMEAVVKMISAEQVKTAVFAMRPMGTHKVFTGEKDAHGRPKTETVHDYGPKKVGTVASKLVDRVGQEQALLDIYQKQYAMLDAFEKRREQARKDSEAEAAKMKKDLLDLEAAFKELMKFTVFDKKGNLKDEYQGEEGRARAVAELQAKQARVMELLNKTGAQLPEQAKQATQYFQQAMSLYTQMGQQTAAQKDQNANLAAIEELTKRETGLRQAIEGVTKAQNELNAAIQTGLSKLVDLRSDVSGMLGLLENMNAGFFKGDLSRSGVIAIQAMIDKLKELNQKAQQDPAAAQAMLPVIDQLIQKLKDIDRVAGTNVLGQVFKGADPNDPGSKATPLMQGLDELKRKINEVSTTRARVTVDQDNLTRALAQVKSLNEQIAAMPDKFKAVSGTAGAVGAAVKAGIDPGTQAYGDFNRELERAILNLQKLDGLKASGVGTGNSQKGKVENHARGGRVGYFGDGGFLADFLSGRYARGTDRVPAMLTRGEYVMNAGSTRQFLPLLRALNAGRVPAGLGGGFSMGDMNITVQGGSTSDRTISSIANGIRRGLRTGAIRPF